MAVGDTVSDWTSRTTGTATTVQPGSGVEWLIHTILGEATKAVDVYFTQNAGTTWTKVATFTGDAHGLIYRLTNTTYLKVQNAEGDTRFVGYCGVITK